MRRLFFALVIAVTLAAPLPAASVDGIRIHSETRGKGKATLIFVHGWTCDSSSWEAQVPAFAGTYRVITLDLPGHGQSASPKDGKFSMDLFARAVEAVREEANAERVVLVGHSMGAPVIRQYERLYPTRVAALVAVDGPLDMRKFDLPAGQKPPVLTGPEGLKVREILIRAMFTPQTPPALQQQILGMMLKAPEATAAGAFAATFDPANRTANPTNVPALAVYSGVAPLPEVGAVEEMFPNYEATQIAGTGHFLMMEKPDEFNKVLSAFLDKIKF
jgi:pimeloyl-ACP methyl ester carboxylesterase